MKVIQRGPEPAKIGVVYCTHGDETAGKQAVEKLLQKDFSFQRGIKFVFANEKAYQQKQRYIDKDLNRVFPGDEESEEYEERIAAEMMKELKDLEMVLDMHETTVEPAPFALYTWNTEEIFDAITKTNVSKAVEISYTPGCGINHYGGIEVETGPKTTQESVETAYQILKQFLINYQVIQGETSTSDTEIYSVYSKMEKPDGDWSVPVKNFQKVGEEEIFAKTDSRKLKTSESFVPVLFDECYSEIFGFKAVRLEKIEDRINQ